MKHLIVLVFMLVVLFMPVGRVSWHPWQYPMCWRMELNGVQFVIDCPQSLADTGLAIPY